jgi:hypothetical protein
MTDDDAAIVWAAVLPLKKLFAPQNLCALVTTKQNKREIFQHKCPCNAISHPFFNIFFHCVCARQQCVFPNKFERKIE